MKVTLRLPSKAIQYGFVEVVVDVPEDATPEFLGAHYVNYVHAFLMGEQGGLAGVMAKPVVPPTRDDDSVAVETIKENLGATVISEQEMAQAAEQVANEKPWEKKVDAPSKPWETGSSKPEVKVATVDW